MSSIVVTVTAFAIFIWAIVKQGNGGPLFSDPEEIYGTGKLTSGPVLGWVMMRCITGGIGGWAGGVRCSDFSRYAVNPGDQIWGQAFIIPLCLLGTNVLGIVTTSAARGFYPNEPLLWKLYDLLEAIQMNERPAARAAVFFATTAFLVSQLCVNVSRQVYLCENHFNNELSIQIVACGVVGGMDLAALFPK
ncbi:hypothetical protein H0H92_010652 [Tricholoma furcatifolium]|nr:hypothetical protein H0H92_010652 [Tricholoma furcatifolium]